MSSPVLPRCPACGHTHTRTRLDPLLETDCPACGVPYATSQRNIELGLLEAVGEAARTRRGVSGGLKSRFGLVSREGVSTALGLKDTISLIFALG